MNCERFENCCYNYSLRFTQIDSSAKIQVNKLAPSSTTTFSTAHLTKQKVTMRPRSFTAFAFGYGSQRAKAGFSFCSNCILPWLQKGASQKFHLKFFIVFSGVFSLPPFKRNTELIFCLSLIFFTIMADPLRNHKPGKF